MIIPKTFSPTYPMGDVLRLLLRNVRSMLKTMVEQGKKVKCLVAYQDRGGNTKIIKPWHVIF